MATSACENICSVLASSVCIQSMVNGQGVAALTRHSGSYWTSRASLTYKGRVQCKHGIEKKYMERINERHSEE